MSSPSDLKELLSKLSIATSKAVDVVLSADTEFDQLAELINDSRMFRCVASLKVCDYDNCGFTRKGKNCGYEQFVSVSPTIFPFASIHTCVITSHRPNAPNATRSRSGGSSTTTRC